MNSEHHLWVFLVIVSAVIWLPWFLFALAIITKFLNILLEAIPIPPESESTLLTAITAPNIALSRTTTPPRKPTKHPLLIN